MGFELPPGSLYADVCLGSAAALETLPHWLEPAGPAAAPNWQRCVYVVAPHEALVKHEALLMDPRIAWAGTEDDLSQLLDLLWKNPSLPMPNVGMDCGSIIGLTFASANRQRDRALAIATRDNHVHFTDAHTRETLGVLEGRINRPLRIVLVTSLHTSVLQYQTASLASAFRSLGHVPHVLIESSPIERMGPISLACAIAEHSPDLVWFIDLLRPQYGGTPQPIPCVCWIQDEMPRLMDPGAIAALGPHDLTYTIIGSPWVDRYSAAGYPWLEELPFAFDDEVYYADAEGIPGDLVALPSNLVEWEENPKTPGMAAWAREYMDAISDIELDKDVAHDMATSGLAALGIEITDAKDRSDVDRSLWFQIREINLIRKARALIAGNVPLELYGSNWNKYPDLAPYYRGIVKNGPDLRALYQQHKVIVHFGQAAMHSRLVEGTACGSMVLAHAPSDGVNALDVVTHANDAEMIEHCHRALTDEPWRQQRVTRSRELALGHTFTARIKTVLNDLRDTLAKEYALLDAEKKKTAGACTEQP